MKINDDFLDGFTGSFRKRNIIIYKIYGQLVGRSFPDQYNLKETKTEIREKQTTWLTDANDTVRKLEPFTNFLYPHKDNCSKRNSFHSHIMKDVMTKEDNKWIMKYEKITLSNGDLRLLPELTLSHLPNHQLKFSWLNNAGKALARNDDIIMIILYNPNSVRYPAIPASKEPILRSHCSFTFSPPDYWYGQSAHIYIYSISLTKKRISNTQYIFTNIP